MTSFEKKSVIVILDNHAYLPYASLRARHAFVSRYGCLAGARRRPSVTAPRTQDRGGFVSIAFLRHGVILKTVPAFSRIPP